MKLFKGLCLVLIQFCYALPQWGVDQIAEDLALWKEQGIRRSEIRRVAFDLAENDWCLVYVKVSEGKLHYTPIGQRVAQNPRYHLFVNSFNQLLSRVDLPESLEFLVTMHDSADCFQSKDLPVPVLTFSKKSSNNRAICMPDCEAIRGYGLLRGKIAQASDKNHWDTKINQAFWRGSSTGYLDTDHGREHIMRLETCLDFPRIRLVALSLEYPNLLDACVTDYFQYSDHQTLNKLLSLSQKTEAVSFQGHLKYKYLVDVDGNTCSYSRMFWILLSNSVLFKEMNGDTQWYYKALKPWVHFVPFTFEAGDLPEKICWAQSHDQQVRQMAKAATSLARQVFSQAMLRNYMQVLFNEYAQCLGE